MPRESELLDSLAERFRDAYGRGRSMLIHQEPQGRGGRRPDMLIVFADPGNEAVDEVFLIPVEIENSSKGAIHDPHNGLRQLRKYPGHAKYLAIPSTIAYRSTGKEIPIRCRKWGLVSLWSTMHHRMSHARLSPYGMSPREPSGPIRSR